MTRVEHIGIAVKNLADSIPLFEKLLNVQHYKVESVASEEVNTAFLLQSGAKLELLESTVPDGIIAKYIERKGEGMHHIAFEVDDIIAEMSRLKEAGFVLLSNEPKKGADNKLVCFVHPKDTNGLLIELVMDINKK